MGALWLWMRRERQPSDPLAAHYRRICKRLEKHGYFRASSEAPGDFAARVVASGAPFAALLSDYTVLFQRLRFATDVPSNADQAQFNAATEKLLQELP
jgi:hypothetical protein